MKENLFSSLWSINEVHTFEILNNKVTKLYEVNVQDEPKSIQVCDKYFAANFGTKLKIYNSAELINLFIENPNNSVTTAKFFTKEFSSNITEFSINNESIAVLSEGRVHYIRMDGESPEKIFPLKDTDDKIFKVVLTQEFLIYTDSTNKLKTYQISQISKGTALVAEYQFDLPITNMFPNDTATKIICIDTHGKGYYYSPVNEKVISLSGHSIENNFKSVLWDNQNENLFIGTTHSGIVYIFVIFEDSLYGPQVNLIKDLTCIEDLKLENQLNTGVKLDNGTFPFVLSNGLMYYFTKGTKEIRYAVLSSHHWIYNWGGQVDKEDGHKKYFMQSYQLGKFWNCIDAAVLLSDKVEGNEDNNNSDKNTNELINNKEITVYSDKRKYLDFLGKISLKYLDIDCAEESFRKGNNISLTLTVEKLRFEQEKKILLGHIAAILGEEDKAEEFFKESSQPSLAVDLRCDLQDWSIALKLAKEYQKYREVFICKKLAYHNESNNNNSEAIKLYEKSKIQNIVAFLCNLENDITNTSHINTDSKDLEEHNLQCDAGIARCCIKLGDTSKAMDIANNLKNERHLLIEIANLAENNNYSVEAAKLYSLIGMYEKACSLYIGVKQFKSAEDLIDKVKNTSLLVQLARMKENEKLYKDAELAYERAGEWDSVIRLNLKNLNNIDKAKDIVLNKHKTESSALLVAEYFENMGRKKETIQFKLIAKKYDEAFAIAQTYNEMDSYADYISKHVMNLEELKKIATYFEGKNNFGKAGIYYHKTGSIKKALNMFIKSNEDEYLEKAVEMIGNSNDTELINQLIDHLLISNIESGPHFLIKLYIFLGNFSKACEIGLELSQQEQLLNKYKDAHKILWDLYLLLKEKNLPISYECNHKLSVLHSYVLAKKLIKLKMILPAARNFLRVANNIQMFEKFIVEILINVCLTCNEAKLSKSASSWAFTLFDNDTYRSKIHSNFKDQIGKLATNAYRNQDEKQQGFLPCPFCKAEIPEYNLTCNNCYNVIPFCIASGKHITYYDLYVCPDCSFPAIGNEFKALLNKDNHCPMCDKEIDVQLLEPVNDVMKFIKSRKVAKVEDNNNANNNNI